MTVSNSSFSKYDLLFWIVLLVCLVALLFCVTAANTFVPFSNETLTDLNTGWTTADGREVPLKTLSDAAAGDPRSVTVSQTLPSALPEGTDLNFRSKNIDFTVSLDGTEVYSFSPEQQLHDVSGRSVGSCFHHIPIPSSLAGKTVSITASPIYKDDSSFISMVSLGDSGAYYQRFMRHNLPPFLLCILILFFGLIMLLLSVTIRDPQVSYYDLEALGTLSIMLGAWSAMETLVPQMLTGTVVLYHGLNYLLLILLPYPAVQFVNSLLDEPRKLYTRIAFYMVMGELVVCSALNFLHIYDFHECLVLVHSGFIVTIVLLVMLLWQNARKARRTRRHLKNTLMLVAFFVFVGLCFVDLCSYVVSNRGSDDAGYFMRIGILVYLAVLFIRSLHRIFARMKLANEAEAIRRVAYTDTLTGLGSRAAFLEKERELQAAVLSGELPEVLVCQMDINELKYVNDNFGHARGDLYIQSAASQIAAAFAGCGDCYRIGGDEFTVFVTAQPAEENFVRCRDALAAAVSAYNSGDGIVAPLHIACGSALFRRGCESIEKTEIEADAAMYTQKREMKAAVL